jgi:hypothetical protein
VFGRFDLMRQYLEVERVSFDPTTTIGVAGIPLVDMSEPCHAAFAAILG